MPERFRTEILQGTKMDTAGIVVPQEVVQALGKGKRPPVKVTISGYSYRSTIASMGGQFLIGLSKEHRQASGLRGGQVVDVTLELDTEPRVAKAPPALEAALREAGAMAAFDGLAPSRRKECVRLVEEAKAPETRDRRIAKIIADLS